MLITIFDSREYYLNFLKRLIARIRRIRPEYRDEDSWCLLHDNAPSHSSLIVRRFLAKNNVCVLNHPPYSLYLAPCDFYLFPKIKLKYKYSVKSTARGHASPIKTHCCSIPLSFVKSAIYGRAREAWESRFLSLAPSIHTRFGLTPMSLLDKRYAYIVPSKHIVVGLLSGHTWTDSFAHRIGVIDDPSCPNCDADREETLPHIVLECSSLDALRFPLLSTCAKELGYTPRSLKDFIFNRSTWRACLEFLKASDRLKPRVRAEDSDHLSDSDSSPHG
ncbi:hypothetical protein LAZ67_2003948 [Cordylochernes scorpioides]|uniref:Transposase n=1 Tax=Cordylochernes scorpioides TaxID=51811 RepID=A0ABY6K3M1_9ARAC|nr:hypothetical protein LAZ67_2003948 [Cordylochernes scorpioides]